MAGSADVSYLTVERTLCLRGVQPVDEVREGRLEFDAVPVAVIAESVPDALNGVISRRFRGLERAEAPHGASHIRGGENISRAVADLRDELVFVMIDGMFVGYHDACFSFFIPHAGQHDGAAAEASERVDQFGDLFAGRPGEIGQAGEQAGFGDIREQHIRAAGQLFHGVDEVRVETGV